MSDYISGSPEFETTRVLLKKQKRKYLIGAVVILPINILLYFFVIDDGTPSERFIYALQAFTYSVTAVGFTIGLVMGLIPYKELNYSRRFLRASLLSILVLQVVFLVLLLFAGLASLRNDSATKTSPDTLIKLENARQEISSKEDSVIAIYEKLISLKKESKLRDEHYVVLKNKASYFHNQMNIQLEKVAKDFTGKITQEEYDAFVMKVKDRTKLIREKKKELQELGIDFEFRTKGSTGNPRTAS